jgi:hypothetical protein
MSRIGPKAGRSAAMFLASAEEASNSRSASFQPAHHSRAGVASSARGHPAVHACCTPLRGHMPPGPAPVPFIARQHVCQQGSG